MGLNAYRLSVEWARIEPNRGQFDQGALDHYRRILEELRERKIQPIVTLHHFTSPTWLADEGGWATASVVDRFSAYVDRVAAEMGHLADWWVTINEPAVFGLFGYITGDWPPHRKGDLGGFLRQGRFTTQAHAAARAVLKRHNPRVMASMAFHLNPMDPVRQGDLTDTAAVKLYDWLWQGRLMQMAAPHLDWVGVNYYFRLLVRWDVLPWHFFTRPLMGPHIKTEYGWEIYPQGLYRSLKRVGKLGKPVIVTENGVSDADDNQRARYLVAHLRHAHKAMAEGVDLRGYMHWSLLDNFEWAEGFTRRFGLAEVDFETCERKLRPSADVYGRIAAYNGIPDGVLHPALAATGRVA
jgi:beta-glucosidase